MLAGVCRCLLELCCLHTYLKFTTLAIAIPLFHQFELFHRVWKYSVSFLRFSIAEQLPIYESVVNLHLLSLDYTNAKVLFPYLYIQV